MKFFLPLIFLLFFASCKQEFNIDEIDIKEPFSLQFFEGGKLKIKVGENAIFTDLNKVFIYSFFASWCDSCKVEAQLLSSLKEKFKDEVEIIGVLMEDLDKTSLKKYKENFGINYKISINTPNIIFEKALGGIETFPHTIVTDKDGIIKFQKTGVIEGEFLQNLLENLLENQK